MITLLIPGFGVLVWFALAIFVALVAHREGFAWWAAVVFGFFTELGILAIAFFYCVEVSNGEWQRRSLERRQYP